MTGLGGKFDYSFFLSVAAFATVTAVSEIHCVYDVEEPRNNFEPIHLFVCRLCMGKYAYAHM